MLAWLSRETLVAPILAFCESSLLDLATMGPIHSARRLFWAVRPQGPSACRRERARDTVSSPTPSLARENEETFNCDIPLALETWKNSLRHQGPSVSPATDPRQGLGIGEKPWSRHPWAWKCQTSSCVGQECPKDQAYLTNAQPCPWSALSGLHSNRSDCS